MANIVLSILGNDKTREAFDSAGKNAEGFKGRTKLAITGIAAAAAAATAGIVGTAVTGAMEAEKSQAKIAGSLGLTAQQSARFGKLAGDVYAQNYGDSLEGVQDALANVATGIAGMKNASNPQLESMTAKVLSFSSAFDMDSSESIQQVNQLIQSKLAKDAPAALDLLTAAMQRVPKAVRGDLVDAVNEYSPFMNQLGLSGAQSMQLLVDSTGKGMFGLDKTGDALKEFSIRSTDMSKTSVSAYKAIGLNAHDMSNDILAGGDRAQSAFQKVVKGVLAIQDPTKRSNTAISLFGTQMEDLGVGDVPKFLKGLQGVGKGMDDTDGAATRLAKTTGGGAANSIATFSRQWEIVTQKLVTGVLPIISQVFGFLSENQWVITAAIVAIGLLAAAFTAVSVAMWIAAAAEAVALAPILLITLGVGALIAAIVLLITHWSDVVTFFRTVWAGVAKWFGDTLTSIGKWWSDTWNGIVGFFRTVLNTAVQLFQNWTLAGIIASHWSQITTGAKTAWNGLLRFIGGVPKAILDFFTGIGRWLLNAGRDLLDGLLDGAKTGLVALGRWEMQIGAKVIGWLADAGSWLVSTGSAILRGLAAGARTGFSAVSSFLGGIGRRVTGALSGAASWLVSIGRDVVAGLVRGLQGAWGAVTGALHNLVNLIPAGARKLLGIQSPSKVFTEIGKFVGEGLRDGLRGSQADVASSMKDLIAKVQDAPAKLFRGGAAVKSRLVADLQADNTILKGLAGQRDTIIKQLDAAKENLTQFRQQRDDFSSGVYNGLNGQAAVTNATGRTDADGSQLPVTAADVIRAKQASLAKTQKFLADVKGLQAAGLNRDDYRAIVEAFQNNGDTSLADTLVAGGPKAIQQINDLNAKFQDAAGALADRTSARLFQSGVEAAKAQVDALAKQRDQIAGAIGVVEKNMAGALSKVGINSSALAAQAGRDIATGLATGVKSQKKMLEGVFDDLGHSLVTAIKKKLKIKSPSGVFRDEVGSMIPAGIIEGITAGAPDVNRSVAALVGVPATAGGGWAGTAGAATAGSGALVHIDEFHATPEQSPADIAANLGWLARGGL